MRLAAAVLLAGGLACCAQTSTLSAKYAGTADHLVSAALADTNGYANLTYLTDRIGNRLSGSASLNRAIAWSVERMKAAGLSNVRKIPTKVPHWVRGQESAATAAAGCETSAHDRHRHERGGSAGRHHRRCCGGLEFRRTGKTRAVACAAKLSFSMPPLKAMGKRLLIARLGPPARPRSERLRRWSAPPRHSPCSSRTPGLSSTMRTSPRSRQPLFPSRILFSSIVFRRPVALSAFIWQCRRILRRMRTARTSLANYPAATGPTRLLSWAGTSIPGMSGRVRRMMAPASWPAWKLLR